MNNIPVNEILGLVEEPRKPKGAPSNAALWVALIFANIIFLVLDAISGVTVYLFTDWWLYGFLTVLAGFVPLLIHEADFVRPFASGMQRAISVIGAVLAVLSVIVIGVCAAIVNVMQIGVSVQIAEVSTIIALVIIAAFHAILFAIYFYVDETIRAEQRTEQMIANGLRKSKAIISAGRVLHTANAALDSKKVLESQYGPQGAEALEYLVKMLTEDKNHDGIPDILQRKVPTQQQRPMVNYASQTRMPLPTQRPEEDEHPNE